MNWQTTFGLCCMIFCVFDWVALSLILQVIETNSFNKPFFIRYCVNSGYSLMVIPWYLMRKLFEHRKQSKLAKPTIYLVPKYSLTTPTVPQTDDSDDKQKQKNSNMSSYVITQNGNIESDEPNRINSPLLQSNNTNNRNKNKNKNKNRIKSRNDSVISLGESATCNGNGYESIYNDFNTLQSPDSVVKEKYLSYDNDDTDSNESNESNESNKYNISSVQESVISNFDPNVPNVPQEWVKSLNPENYIFGYKKCQSQYKGSFALLGSHFDENDNKYSSIGVVRDDFIPELTDKELMVKLIWPCSWIGFIGIMSGYLWYWSLKYIPTAINNTLYQSQSIFVFVFSVCILNERMTFQKIGAILISFSGVALVSYSSQRTSNNDSDTFHTILGLCLCLASTFSFSFAEVSLKAYGNILFRKDRKIQDTLLFQTIMGITTFLFWWPFFYIFDVANLEAFSTPAKASDWYTIGVSGLLDMLYQAAFFSGITLINAVVMSMGSLLVIPVSFIADIIFNGMEITFMAVFGACLVIIGFLFMEFPIRKLLNKRLNV